MVRVRLLLLLFCVIPHAASAQPVSVLHIKIVLVDAQGQPMPVARHTLLVSDNPSTALPRIVVTGVDGTADLKLRPGNYTVESERPVMFEGKSYQWIQLVDVAAGHDEVMELTAANAEVASAPSATSSTGASLEADPSFLLPQWGKSVVALWTPYTRASGFVVDGRGLVITSQRAIGSPASAEVQLTPALKVEGRVLASDPARDVAVLWINPKTVASVRPVPLPCGQPPPEVADGQEVYTIGVPLRQQEDLATGRISRVQADVASSDFMLGPGAAGGPVFTADGRLAGITSALMDEDRNDLEEIRVVRTGNACAVLTSAEAKMQRAAPPPDTPLPVEPARSFPVDALKEIVRRRVGSLSPYQVASSEFDIAFITPVHTYGAQYQAEQARTRDRSAGARPQDVGQVLQQRLTDFGNWSLYFDDIPPVLIVRATPKMAESFWATMARGAARTQGMAIPPLKRFKSSFARLQAFCGNTEVIPIHPFKLELRLSENNSITEGLYVFNRDVLGPRCGTVKLVLYSEKEPDKPDTRVVDPAVVEQVWKDFEPYRAAGAKSR